MKKLLSIAFAGAMFVGIANAVEVRTYYLDTCPWCNRAKEFINGDLLAEFPHIQIVNVDVSNRRNHPQFMASMEMCNDQSGAVPLIIVGGTECIAGYSRERLREAVANAPVNVVAAPVATQKKNQQPASPPARNLMFLLALLAIGAIAFGMVLLTEKKK